MTATKVLASFLIGLACGISLSIPAMVLGDDWPTYQHDPTHTGQSTAAFDPMLLTKVWSAPQGYGNPLVVGNSIYAMRNGAEL